MPDRKFICTLSLFLMACGLLTGGWFVRPPDYIGIYVFGLVNSSPLPLPIWLLCELGVPFLGFVIIVAVTKALWYASATLCAKLRGEAKP